MRILIFTLSYFPLVGGAEVAIKEITDRIQTDEFDMVTLRFDKSHLKQERIGNVNVHRIGGGLGYLSKIFFVFQAALFARKREYDLYWCMMTYMLFPISILRLMNDKTAYVLTLQDGDPFSHVFNRFRIKLFKPLLTFGFGHAFKVQTISKFLAKWARDCGYKGEPLVIPNGVDVKKFLNNSTSKKEGETVLITTSRLVQKNAVGDIIEALAFMPENIKLKILGTGPLEKSLKLKVRNLKLEDRVEFLGLISQEEIPQHLSNADIFIRPSLSEGQGISFIEAMASGLPVIATAVGGIPDFVEDGVTGLFVEPKSPRLIAFQVNKLISDRVLRDKIIINAKRMIIEKYDWDLIAQEMKSNVFSI